MISATIAVVFYSYTAVLGRNLLIFDIATFFIAILVGQIVANWSASFSSNAFRLFGKSVLVVQVVFFSAFTFAPPPLALFEDSRNGKYGLAAYEPSEPDK